MGEFRHDAAAAAAAPRCLHSLVYEAEKSEENALTGLLLAAGVAAAESGFL